MLKIPTPLAVDGGFEAVWDTWVVFRFACQCGYGQDMFSRGSFQALYLQCQPGIIQ